MNGPARGGQAGIWWCWFGLCMSDPGFVTVEDMLKERRGQRLTVSCRSEDHLKGGLLGVQPSMQCAVPT